MTDWTHYECYFDESLSEMYLDGSRRTATSDDHCYYAADRVEPQPLESKIVHSRLMSNIDRRKDLSTMQKIRDIDHGADDVSCEYISLKNYITRVYECIT